VGLGEPICVVRSAPTGRQRNVLPTPLRHISTLPKAAARGTSGCGAEETSFAVPSARKSRFAADSFIQSGGARRIASALQSIDQFFDALCAQPRDVAVTGTASPTSITGTTLTSFQKLYFETNETITFGSLDSTRT
jgi:hypothetical protein